MGSMSHRTRPVCGNEACPCGKPGKVCLAYIGYYGPYCIRCGWEARDHKPLIHKGGKP